MKIGLLFILPSGHTCLQQQSVFEFIFAIETKLQIQIASCANVKKIDYFEWKIMTGQIVVGIIEGKLFTWLDS